MSNDPRDPRNPPPRLRPVPPPAPDAGLRAAPDFQPVRERRDTGPAGLRAAQLAEVFTPTRPKSDAALFRARTAELRRVIAAIEEEHSHVVIFGDRGWGKSSLANIVVEKALGAGYTVVRATCSSEISFERLFRGLLADLPARLLDPTTTGFGRARELESVAGLLPADGFGPTELADTLRQVSGAPVILVIDEFDRVASERVRNDLAEAIKNLSDTAARVSLLIVGVASSYESLLGKHPSIRRHLTAVRLPLMTDAELRLVIEAGAEKARVRFEDDVLDTMLALSRGLPYWAQLLALYSARSAVERAGTGAAAVLDVERADLRHAVGRVLEAAEHHLKDLYESAVGGAKSSLLEDTLWCAARADCDPYGAFGAPEVSHVDLGGRRLPLLGVYRALGSLVRASRGAVLEKVFDPSEVRYRFSDPMLAQYVLVRQARARGML